METPKLGKAKEALKACQEILKPLTEAERRQVLDILVTQALHSSIDELRALLTAHSAETILIEKGERDE